jgi:hypothetical protein
VPSRCLYRCLYRPLNLVARRCACAVPLTNEDALPMRFCR